MLAGLLGQLAQIPAPGCLAASARDYWEPHAADPCLLDGDGIVHRDPHPTNFVVDSDRAWMTDLGWSVRGPAWMTSANLIISLMEAGWDAADADKALHAVPAWASAPRAAVAELARAQARKCASARGPVHPVWELRARVAREWAAYAAGAG